METIVIAGGGAGGLELATRLGDTLGAERRAGILLADAEDFRQRFFDTCIRASERKAPVHIVIVGGGATGVELAAELSNTARALAAYRVHALDPEQDIRISIIERGDYLLPQLDTLQSQRAERHLRTLGIGILTGTAVATVSADAVTDSTGRVHPADITVWAAGVEAPALCATFGLEVDRLNRVVVDNLLCSVDDAHIHALGDCAAYTCPVKGPTPPRAQVAHQQAMFLAALLARRNDLDRQEFRYRDHGSLVSLGQQAAVGVLTGSVTGRRYRVGGATARVLYRLLYQKHLLQLHGAMRVLAQTLADWLRARVLPPVRLHR